MIPVLLEPLDPSNCRALNPAAPNRVLGRLDPATGQRESDLRSRSHPVGETLNPCCEMLGSRAAEDRGGRVGSDRAWPLQGRARVEGHCR